MGNNRKRLDNLFIVNPKIYEKKNKFIWIDKEESTIQKMICTFEHCVTNNIYFCGFVTDCSALIGLFILNKCVYDINGIKREDSLVLLDDSNSPLYCPVKVMNPRLNQSEIVVWGAGHHGSVIAEYFKDRNISISCFIDKDKNKIGKNINGAVICGLEKVEKLSAETSLIEATERHHEIDDIMVRKAPNIDCFVYDHTKEYKSIAPRKLMYLKEIVGNRKIYIYGNNEYAWQLSRCLEILDYQFSGFLAEKDQGEQIYITDEVWMTPEELLYSENYFVIVVSDVKRAAVDKLKALGLRYPNDFSPIEILSYNLLYARRNIIDTNLGHTYKQRDGMDGVTLYGKISESIYKIVVLGGSTTDGKLFPFPSWPEIMFNKIDNDRVHVYNAGVSGYTSAQELIKLIRDVVLIKPDMVIVYDGYNDTSEINACPGNYFEFAYLKKALDFARDHMNHEWDFILQDEEAENDIISPIIGNFENWLMNIEMMHAIAADRGIKFYSFLQPMLSNKTNLSREEKGILFEAENFCGLKKTSLMGKEFRSKIVSVASSHDYIYDLSDIFDDLPNIYMDICHVREEANEIIAAEILKRIDIPF